MSKIVTKGYSRRFLLISFVVGLCITCIPAGSYAANEVAQFATAPAVPPALNRGGGANVVVNLEMVEKKG